MKESLISLFLLILSTFTTYEISISLHSPLFLALLMVFQVILIIQLVLAFHDCLHLASFKSKRANALLGRLIGAFGMWPYHFLQESHLTHHRKTGLENEDTEILHFTESMAKKSWIVAILSRIARSPLAPILFTPLIQAKFFSRWFSSHAKNWKDHHSQQKLLRYFLDSACMVIFWYGLHLLTQQRVNFSTLFFFGYLTPGVIAMGVVYLFANPLHTQMVSVPGPDLGMKNRVFYTSRTFDSNALIRILIGNLNYHIEHHLNPTTSRWELREISLRERSAYQEFAKRENLPYALHSSYLSWYLKIHLKAPRFNVIQNTDDWKKVNPAC